MAKDDQRTLTPRLRLYAFHNEIGWNAQALGDVVRFSSGGTPSKDEASYWNGNIPWISASSMYDIKICNSDHKVTPLAIGNGTRLAPKGSILVLVRGSMLFNRVPMGIADIDVAFNQDVKALAVSDGVNPDFLLNQLLALSPRIPVNETGIGAGKIDTDTLAKLTVYFPSLPEQQKIADCLTSLDELIAAQGRKVEALKAHKKSLMQQLFPREGETLPRLRFPEFRDEPEWERCSLIEIAKFRRGSFPQPYGLPEWFDDENGTPFVQVFDVGDNFRLKNKTKNRISALAADQSVFISKGTLIVTLQGSIGRVAITQYDAYVDRTLLLFESFLRPLDTVFFAYVVHNLFEIEKQKAPGGIIKTITKEVFSAFVVKLPSLSEQKQIADCLSTLDAQIAAEADKLAALKTHKQALMQQLFPSPQLPGSLLPAADRDAQPSRSPLPAAGRGAGGEGPKRERLR